MKNIFVLVLVTVLSVMSYSVKAQSSQKLQARWQQELKEHQQKMDEGKTYRNSVVQKANEQQSQQRAEKKPVVNTSPSHSKSVSTMQTTEAAGQNNRRGFGESQQALKKQQLPDTKKKEELNQ